MHALVHGKFNFDDVNWIKTCKMKKTNLLFLIVLLFFASSCKEKQVTSSDSLKIVYWTLTPKLYGWGAYSWALDSIAKATPHQMVFVRMGKGCDLYNYSAMTPILKRIVTHAHQLDLKIGLQLPNNLINVQGKEKQSLLTEVEIQLDANGNGVCELPHRSIRLSDTDDSSVLTPVHTELYRTFVFKKVSQGIYEPNSLKDITSFCNIKPSSTNHTIVSIHGDKRMAGYTAYLMAVHDYNYPRSFSYHDMETTLRSYSRINFDGVAIAPTDYKCNDFAQGMNLGDSLSEKFFSREMEQMLEKRGEMPAEILLLTTRYFPKDFKELRTEATKTYLEVLHQEPERAEQKFYTLSKQLFGPICVVGVHNRFYNTLIAGEDMKMSSLNWGNL